MSGKAEKHSTVLLADFTSTFRNKWWKTSEKDTFCTWGGIISGPKSSALSRVNWRPMGWSDAQSVMEKKNQTQRRAGDCMQFHLTLAIKPHSFCYIAHSARVVQEEKLELTFPNSLASCTRRGPKGAVWMDERRYKCFISCPVYASHPDKICPKQQLHHKSVFSGCHIPLFHWTYSKTCVCLIQPHI